MPTGPISKGSKSPRGRPYKKEREKNVRNVLSEISTSISLSTCLLGPFPKVPEVQEAVPIKKKEKRTLETFLAKFPLPLALNLPTRSISKGSRSPKGRPYKKEREKNVKNVFGEISTPISSKLAYWIHF